MEEIDNEELGAEELQLLQEIHDELVAFNNKFETLTRDLQRELGGNPENRRKRTDGERKAMLVERLFRRYNPCSVEFLDHLPYLEKRLYRIHRAGKQNKPRSKSGAAKRTGRSRRA